MIWTRKKVIIALAICTIALSTFTILQMSQTTQAALIDPHPGLVAWYRFDEGSGTAAEDSSGNGNDGIIHGGIWAAGKFGNSLSFGGTTDYVEILDSTTLNPQFESGMAWIKLSGISSQAIFTKPYCYRFYILSGGQLRITIWDDTGEPTILTGLTVLTTGVWYHVAWSYDGNDLILYVNGQYEASTAKVGVLDTTGGNPMQIGAWVASADFFNGIIDEVRIFNRAISQAEIQADSQQGPSFSSNLLAKVPKGTTQVITTISWQGTGNINTTIKSPVQTFTEDMIPSYQKTVYSTAENESSMLNIKRLSVSVAALTSDEDWIVLLSSENVRDYRITVEVQK